MRIYIIIYEESDWKKDNLESRMVDKRIEELVEEFKHNSIFVKVIRKEES